MLGIKLRPAQRARHLELDPVTDAGFMEHMFLVAGEHNHILLQLEILEADVAGSIGLLDHVGCGGHRLGQGVVLLAIEAFLAATAVDAQEDEYQGAQCQSHEEQHHEPD